MNFAYAGNLMASVSLMSLSRSRLLELPDGSCTIARTLRDCVEDVALNDFDNAGLPPRNSGNNCVLRNPMLEPHRRVQELGKGCLSWPEVGSLVRLELKGSTRHAVAAARRARSRALLQALGEGPPTPPSACQP